MSTSKATERPRVSDETQQQWLAEIQRIPLARGRNFATMRISSSLRMTYNVLTILASEIEKLTTKSPEEKVLAMYITSYETSNEMLLGTKTARKLKSSFEFTTASDVWKRLRGGGFWTSTDGDSYTAIVAVFDAAFASTNKDMMTASACMLRSLRIRLSEEDNPLRGFSMIALSDTGIPFFPDRLLLGKKFGSNVVVTDHVLEDEHPPRVVFHDSPCSFPKVADQILESLYRESDGAHRELTQAPRLVVFTTAAKNAGPLKKILLTRPALEEFLSAGELRTWIVTTKNVTKLLPTIKEVLKQVPNIKAVVWFEPEVRFSLPLKHVHKHFAFASESKFVFNRIMAETVEDFVPVSKLEAQSFASVGHFDPDPAEITLLRREDAKPLPIFPSTASLAWLVEPMETLLFLIHEHPGVAVKDFLAVMSHACMAEPDLVDEMLHRLTQRRLIWDDQEGDKGSYSLTDPSMPAQLSASGRLSDACLLVEMTKLAKEEGVSMAALQTLAACRSVMLVTVDWVWKHVDWNSVAVSELHKACIGPGAEMSQKGPLWLAMGLVARALRSWDSTGKPTTFQVESGDKVTTVTLHTTLLAKFKNEMANTCSIVGIPTEEWDSWASAVLSRRDMRLVEKILVKCHIDQLFVAHDPEASDIRGHGLVTVNAISILETACVTLDSNLRDNTLWCLVQNPPRARAGPDAQFSASLLTCVSAAAVRDALSEFGPLDADDNDISTRVHAVRDRYLLGYKY